MTLIYFEILFYLFIEPESLKSLPDWSAKRYSELEKKFRTSNVDELTKIKNDIIKNLGDIGKLTDKFYKDKNILLEHILLDSSIFGVKQTKIDTDSQLDFNKLIQKIIFNYDEINKDLVDMKPLISTITKENFDNLIKVAKQLKLQMKNLGILIFNPDGSLKLTSVDSGGKLRFKDMANSIKDIVDKHIQFEEIVVDLSNNYNPTRTQPEQMKGGGRNEYIFNDLLNHLPSRYH